MNARQMPESGLLSRRAWFECGTLFLSAAALSSSSILGASSAVLRAAETRPLVRIGLLTDLHYADKPAAGTRHYRETTAKLAAAAEEFRRQTPDCLIELGDLIDAADSVATEQGWLKTINRQFSAICRERYYVLGNHCVDTLTKDEFLGAVEQPRSYFSFDRNGVHVVILDACYRSDGVAYGRKNSTWDDANIPAEELEWLRADLKDSKGPVLVFAHQRLDGSDRHCVKNAAEVRNIFEASGRVLAVFQGHSHQNDYREIGGIHYGTLAAMVEGSGPDSNGYALLEVFPESVVTLRGFRRQSSYRWT